MIIAMTGKKEKEIIDNDYIVKENVRGGRGVDSIHSYMITQ